MNPLQTDNKIALSFLIDEDIYIVDEVAQITELEEKAQVIEEVKKEHVTKQEAISYPYLGDNNKYILIVVQEESAQFVKQSNLDFLIKILGAKKLSLNDVAILNISKTNNYDFESLKSFFAFSKIITFGINPTLLKIEGAIANKKSVYNNIPILGTWALDKLAENKEKKAVFWNELKTF